MLKKFFIVAIILVVIILVILFLLSQRKQPIPNNQLPITNNSIINQPNTNQELIGQKDLTLAEKAELERQKLIVQVRNFIERYGSFSTDANFANLYELKDEMTNRFWLETEKSLDKAQNNTFYSISTKVLKITEKTFFENSATHSVSTQRKEIKNKIEKILYQNVEIKMVKEQGSWKVNSVKWE